MTVESKIKRFIVMFCASYVFGVLILYGFLGIPAYLTFSIVAHSAFITTLTVFAFIEVAILIISFVEFLIEKFKLRKD